MAWSSIRLYDDMEAQSQQDEGPQRPQKRKDRTLWF